MSGDLIQAVCEAFANVTECNAKSQAARDRLAELKTELQAKRHRRDELRELEDRDAALRALDGADAAPIDEVRRQEIGRLNEGVPALETAAKLQEGRLREAERDEAVAIKALTGPTLHLVGKSQCEAVDRASGVLADLVPTFAELIAADQLRAALIGDLYAVPDGCPAPFRGLTVVRNVLGAIPDNMKPAELAESLLLQAAHEISSKIIAEIEGKKHAYS